MRYLSIAENVKSVFNRIDEAAKTAGRSPDEISLVAASKMNSADRIQEAILAGIKICGENRVQELVEKRLQNAYDGSKLHFIGHLQKNKVKQVVGMCDLIQSVDSIELLSLIDKRAEVLGVTQDILLEINIASENTKSGMKESDLPLFLENVAEYKFIRVRGLMAIPPISHAKGENRAHFARMYKLFVDNSSKKYDNVSMDFLSMGMSDDFEDAIAEGSNMVRVGSAIFGFRPYQV